MYKIDDSSIHGRGIIAAEDNTFKLHMDDNDYYTVVFKSGDRTKYVYIDTNSRWIAAQVKVVMTKEDTILYGSCGTLQYIYQDEVDLGWIWGYFPISRSHKS